MKYGIIFMLVLLTGFIYGTARLDAEVEIALEAELANEIVEPMIIDEDKDASDGKFIWMEGAPVAGGGGGGSCRFYRQHPRTREVCPLGSRHRMGWQ